MIKTEVAPHNSPSKLWCNRGVSPMIIAMYCRKKAFGLSHYLITRMSLRGEN
jgi:hypothetical protein